VTITVQLFGVFRIGRFKERVLEQPPGASVQAVVDLLRLSTPLLGTVLVNGVHARLEDQLKDGDLLIVLPILEGG
jgi:molybdopterin converting factor small subunit